MVLLVIHYFCNSVEIFLSTFFFASVTPFAEMNPLMSARPFFVCFELLCEKLFCLPDFYIYILIACICIAAAVAAAASKMKAK